MRIPVAITAGIALAALTLAPANAHSLKDLERLMGDKEKYFQSIDKDAPDFSLQDADGRPVSFAGLRGKVVVLHFIYAGCPDVCPLHADRIGEIQKLVNQSPMKDQVQFISITTDPKNDSADVLRAYGPLHGLERTNWTFLTTTSDQPEEATRNLAEQFGHKFVKLENGFQIHGVVTHVIGKDGRWRANFHGLRFDSVNLVAFVNGLVNDVAKPHEEPGNNLWQKLRSWF